MVFSVRNLIVNTYNLGLTTARLCVSTELAGLAFKRLRTIGQHSLNIQSIFNSVFVNTCRKEFDHNICNSLKLRCFIVCSKQSFTHFPTNEAYGVIDSAISTVSELQAKWQAIYGVIGPQADVVAEFLKTPICLDACKNARFPIERVPQSSEALATLAGNVGLQLFFAQCIENSVETIIERIAPRHYPNLDPRILAEVSAFAIGVVTFYALLPQNLFVTFTEALITYSISKIANVGLSRITTPILNRIKRSWLI
jgi:hypothetical protein